MLTLTVPRGLTPAQANAQLTTRGVVHNALLITVFSDPLMVGAAADLAATVAALDVTAAAVQRGELGDAEALLMAQAVMLNTIFTRSAVQASRCHTNPADCATVSPRSPSDSTARHRSAGVTQTLDCETLPARRTA